MTRIVLFTALAGCGARFVDERPAPADGAVASAADAASAPDAAVSVDGSASPSPNPDLAVPGDVTLATGTFAKGQQSGGDTGSGSARLLRAPDGQERIVFGADFQSTPVPAGEVVLTTRDAIGAGGIDSSLDLDLGPLVASKGSQSYALPAGDGGRHNLFVYCVSFGIDVAVAHLQ